MTCLVDGIIILKKVIVRKMYGCSEPIWAYLLVLFQFFYS